MKKGTFYLWVVLVVVLAVNAQNEDKTYTTSRIENAPKIDGVLDEDFWQDLPVATDFIQTLPSNGKKATQKTEVKIAYDDHAIYIGATMYDSIPDQIYHGLGKRDAFDNDILSDFFIVEFNPYNDDQLLYSFKLAASGVQIDEKVTYGNWDKSWDAIWYSDVKINDNGWVAEIKIPYLSLRIPSAPEQEWGMHLWRHIRRNEEWVSWNFVNETEPSTVHQVGTLKGIKNIDPPVRLSFTPYTSVYWIKDSKNNTEDYAFKGGLDLKYGINESYTLDMMLIPDFGQVQSDDAVLNLSTVEVRFNENRAFFTEGTELFNKANIFYSRRIGTTPRHRAKAYENLQSNESVIENPNQTQIVNTTKVSGRNNQGLAVGFLNAVSTPSEALVQNSVTGEQRKVRTQNWTNYNVFVLDQALKNNSSISIINTNNYQHGANYTANVTGLDFKFSNAKNTYALFGKGALSQIYTDDTDLGYYYNIAFNKTKGKLKYGLNQNVISDTYNPSDMGYLANNNNISNNLWLSYDIIQPKGKILNWYNSISLNNTMLYKPTRYANLEINMESSVRFKNQWHLMGFAGGNPSEKYDYYEPRMQGYRYEEPSSYYFGGSLQTDTRKTFACYIEYAHWWATEFDKSTHIYKLSPSFRINNKLTFSYMFGIDFLTNAIGYVSTDWNTNTIYFGRRNITPIQNTFTANYIFSKNSSVSLRARHYQSTVRYQEFYTLNQDGTFNPNPAYTSNDINFNAFTVDLVYAWQFAPGSQLSLVWKNNINTNGNYTAYNYAGNLYNTLKAPQVNSVSLRVLYFLDYMSLRKKS